MTVAIYISTNISPQEGGGPFNLLADMGRWIWLHAVSSLWIVPGAIFPDTSWILPLGLLALVGVLIWRKTQGVRLAYRNPGVFNLAHGSFWLPVAWWLLAFTLIFSTPLLSSLQVPAWRPLWAHCLISNQVFIVMGFGALAIPFALVMSFRRLFREQIQPGIHGEAGWASRSEVRFSKSWPWLIPIQVHFRGTRRPWTTGGGFVILAPSREVSRRHTLVRGGTGSGKGHFIFGHILTSARHATIYQDVKDDGQPMGYALANTMVVPIRWGAAAEGGRPSMQWNPLEECCLDPNPEDAYETLASVLIQGDDGDWVPQLARPILAWVFASGRYQTLGGLADDFTERGVESVLKDIGLPGGLMESLEGKNVKEYIGTTIFSHLAPFRSGWGRAVTGGHDFSLSDIIRRGGYVLSAETIASRRVPLIVFWRLLFRKMLRTTEPMDLTLLMDEGLAAGKIPDFADALNTLRSKGVSIVFAIQNTAGLREIYGPQGGPAVEEAFTNRITLLNGLNNEDAEKLTKRLGTYTRIRKQRQGTPTHDRADLMPLEEVARRGAGETDRWAVIEVVGATNSNRPIIARLVPSDSIIRTQAAGKIPSVEKTVMGLHSTLQEKGTEADGNSHPAPPSAPPPEDAGGF
jgi:hypothetical protein